MASCSRAFRKPKSAAEFNRECHPIVNTSSDKMVSEKFSGMAGKTKIDQAIEPCTFTTYNSKVQRLDTDIANMMAESLTFCLTKFVLLI